MIKVWTNGCFDIIHRGHIELFKYAKSFGDELVVGLDSDEKVIKDKGIGRPFNNINDRKEVLMAIKYIDEVIIFDDTADLEKTIEQYKPDIMVIGSDWKNGKVIGRQFVKKLVFFDRIEGYSTTEILNR